MFFLMFAFLAFFGPVNVKNKQKCPFWPFLAHKMTKTENLKKRKSYFCQNPCIELSCQFLGQTNNYPGRSSDFPSKMDWSFFGSKFSKSLKFDPKMPKKGPSNKQFFIFFCKSTQTICIQSRANFWDIWTHFSLKIAIFRRFLTPFCLI